jgi:hypothetical protein
VDYDGKESCSQIIAVGFRRTAAEVTALLPNPAKSFVDIRMSGTESSETPGFVLRNSLGATIRSGFLTLLGSGSWRLDGLGDLPAGMYLVEIRLDDTVSHHRILLAKD